MTDEQMPKNRDGQLSSDEMTDAEIADIADAPVPANEYPAGQAEEYEERLPEPERNAVEEAVIEAHRESEALAQSGVPKAFGDAVTAIEQAIESIPGPPARVEEVLAPHEDGETSVFLGREFPVPLYTVVFGVLALLTLTEVTLSELLSEIETIKIAVLLSIAGIKAGLVAWFYMHLKDDNRTFAVTFGVPAGIVLLSILFLLGIPQGY